MPAPRPSSIAHSATDRARAMRRRRSWRPNGNGALTLRTPPSDRRRESTTRAVAHERPAAESTSIRTSSPLLRDRLILAMSRASDAGRPPRPLAFRCRVTDVTFLQGKTPGEHSGRSSSHPHSRAPVPMPPAAPLPPGSAGRGHREEQHPACQHGSLWAIQRTRPRNPHKDRELHDPAPGTKKG